MFLHTFGMEPPILQSGYLAFLLQSRVLVVNLLDELAVASYDMNLGDGYTNIIQNDSFKIQLLNLPLQRFLAPYVILIVAIDKSYQRHLRGLEFHLDVLQRVALHEIRSRVIARLKHSAFVLQLLQRNKTYRIGMHGNADSVVIYNILRQHIRIAPVTAGIGQNNIGIAAFKHLQRNTPILHHKLVGEPQLVHNGTKHIDIASCRLSLIIQVLVGCFIPVAHNDNRTFIVIFLRQLLGSTTQSSS